MRRPSLATMPRKRKTRRNVGCSGQLIGLGIFPERAEANYFHVLRGANFHVRHVHALHKFQRLGVVFLVDEILCVRQQPDDRGGFLLEIERIKQIAILRLEGGVTLFLKDAINIRERVGLVLRDFRKRFF